jgi:hypothetical protein
VQQPLHKGNPPVYYYQTRADGCMIKIKNKDATKEKERFIRKN